MTRRSETVDLDWVDALEASLAVFARLVLDPAVVRSWSEPSRLPGYTIGGIAGHVLSLMVGLQRRVDSIGPPVDLIHYTDWFGPALRSEEQHVGLIEVGEQLAAVGPSDVAVRFWAVGRTLGPTLRSTQSDFAVPLASLPGRGVRLDDFLRTRFVEVVVHADDVASGAGIPRPNFSEQAGVLAASVVNEISAGQGSTVAYVVARARPPTSA